MNASHSSGRLSAHPRPLVATPVPWAKVLTIGLTLLVNHFSILVVFPILPFMVADFLPDTPPAQLGYRVGFMASSFFLGQMVAAYLWGWAADVYGRRRTLLLGLLGTVVSVIAFGLSPTFSVALAVRFLWGLLNGNVPVCKAYLSDVLDPTNKARGFSVFGLQAALGRLLGPALGGLLARPAQRFPALAAALPFLALHPYLLPCLVAAGLGLLGFACTYFFLPEPTPTSNHDCGSHEDELSAIEEGESPCPNDLGPLLPNEPADEKEDSSASLTTQAPEGLKFLLSNRGVLVSSTLFALVCLCHIGFEELFPLWLLNDPAHNGFGFDEGQIGLAIACTGPIQLLTQFLFVPWLVTKVSYRGGFRLAMASFGLAVFAAPFWSLVHSDSAALLLAAAAVSYMAVNVPVEAAYTYVFVLVNDSVDSHLLGRANGVAAVFAAVMRTIGPSLWGSLFAWSAGANRRLLFHAPFLAIAALALLAAQLTRCLPPAAGGK